MSCSLVLTGTGYLSCRDNQIMYIENTKLFDVTVDSRRRIHLEEVQMITEESEKINPKSENLTTSEIIVKLGNTTSDLLIQAQNLLSEYVSIFVLSIMF